MSSEIPENARDAALRRMLVATASAAPVRPRRRWSLAALVTGLLLAGATVGAVSATAFQSHDGRDLMTMGQLADAVIAKAEPLGDPIEIDGAGTTVGSFDDVPEGATDLAIAYRCITPGSLEFLLDGRLAMTMECDDLALSSVGGGGYFPADEWSMRTLTVVAPAETRYLVWASWVARDVDPAPSPEQAAALADGEVTEAEYREQFRRFAACMQASGHPLLSIDESGTIIRYTTSSAAADSGVDGECYVTEFRDVDAAWQGAHAEPENEQLTACLAESGDVVRCLEEFG